ncbi:MAG: hypothetical protein Q8N99_08270 [Nanoarchaeota archaeon]|nr:hypothetical protein [Nanoarchaeota archaeon]
MTLKDLESAGLVSRKPKPIFVFLLAFAYFLIWLFTFTFYYKYDIKTLKIPMIGITIITLFTLGFGVVHLFIYNILNKKEKIED